MGCPLCCGRWVAAAHVWLTMMESWGLGRQRNSVTQTIQKLRLPGERFPALEFRGTKSWRRKSPLKAARIHRASHLQGKALKLNCRAFIFSVPEMAFLLKRRRKEGRGRRDFSPCCPISPALAGRAVPRMGPRFLTSKGVGRGRCWRSSPAIRPQVTSSPGACPAGGIWPGGEEVGTGLEAGVGRPLL